MNRVLAMRRTVAKGSLPWSLQAFKDWWWLVGIIVGAVVVWGNLPARMAKAEQQIDDLKGWAKEIQGYTRAQQQINQRQQEERVPVPTPPAIQRYQDPQGRLYCWDGTRSWWANAEGRCG